MPSMTEELGRLASAIAAQRRERAEAASARRSAAGMRHQHSNEHMRTLKSERLAMARAQEREMIAARRRREAMVAELMRGFRRTQVQRHRQRLAMSAAERARIDAFMGELTARAATLRQELGASREARAAARRTALQALREELGEYRRDRKGAHAAWRGHGAKPPASRRSPAEPRPQGVSAGPPVAQHAPPVPPSASRRPRHHPLPPAANESEGER